MKTKKLVQAAVFAALVCVLTMVVKIELPSGYANLGDCACIAAGMLLGPIGALSAAIGSAIADLIGFPFYAPATFIIKGAMTLAAFYVYKALGKKNLGVIIGAIVAEIIMVLGYFVFELIFVAKETAVLDLVGNGAQGAIGAVTSVILVIIVKKYCAKFFE